MSDIREIARALGKSGAGLFKTGWEKHLADLGMRSNSASEGYLIFDWKSSGDVVVFLTDQGCPERIGVTVLSFPHAGAAAELTARLEDEFAQSADAAVAVLGEPDYCGRTDQEENPYELASAAELAAVWDSDQLLVMLEAESSHGDPASTWEISLAVEPALPEN